MKRLSGLALIGCALCAIPQAAFAWWNADWTFRKELTLDLSAAGANIAASPLAVPVLVRLSAANFEFWADAKPDGSDLRFVLGDDRTPLKFHVERWDSTSQLAYVWVQVPRLAGGAATDKFYMYYGNASAPNGAEPAASYDREQVLTLHFSEADGLPKDATAHAIPVSASTAERVPASLIGGGVRVAGGQSITVPASGPLRLVPTAGATLSLWVKPARAQPDALLLQLQDGAKEFTLALRDGRAVARVTTVGGPVEAVGTAASVTAEAWHHVAATVGGGRLVVYVDGAEAAGVPAQPVEVAGTLTIGAAAGGGAALEAELDEVQVASVARPAEWIRAAASSQGMDAKLVVYGADSQKEGESTSYFGTIAKNLTVDGWVIIVICMAMLFIAIVIMLLKALHLGRVERANREFTRDFESLKGDPRALDHSISAEDAEFAAASPAMAALAKDGGQYSGSSLFALYHVGVAELDKRLGKGSVGARRAAVLSPQSIEAIRASLDAAATRNQQTLSARMVLLTIAISGGPFLGLLGTVIGVMITFAAIAASGDVNVNAIAPGTAAALAATVAGLAVAIPCLFGYNWLNTRVKSIVADNRVFVDEFVARMAEQYS